MCGNPWKSKGNSVVNESSLDWQNNLDPRAEHRNGASLAAARALVSRAVQCRAPPLTTVTPVYPLSGSLCSCLGERQNWLLGVKSKERNNPLNVTGARLATARFPTPKGFDAHPYFFGAFLPIFPQFQTPFADSLPKSQGASRC